MKWFKKIVIGILVLLLMDMIVLLALSFNAKKIIIDGVIKEIIIQKVSIPEYQTPCMYCPCIILRPCSDADISAFY